MTDLETLLRATTLTEGRISLSVNCAGTWRATVSHYNGHMTWAPDGHGDPVEALRVALFEDARQADDLRRRYEAAPKLGATPAATTDVEDMLG
jgi:hypothetical protein